MVKASSTKVLYLYENLRIGGAEQLFLNTLRYLNCDKFSPTVYCIGEKGTVGEQISAMGIPVKALKKNTFLGNLTILFTLIKVLKQEKPDILHTNLYLANIYGRVAAKLSGIKRVVTTLHNPDYSYEDNGRLSYKIRKLVDKYTGLYCNSCFIAVSDFVKKDFQKQLGFKNIKVLHNAIDTAKFTGLNAEQISAKRRELGFTDKDIVLLNIGRLHPQKGQVYLIKALKLLRRENESFKLVLIGKGNLGGELKKLASELSLGDSVVFLDNRLDIPLIMGASDLFVFPSLYEGFGIAVVEAMSCGIPVIANDIETLREIITNRKDGILIEKASEELLAQEILKLANNPGLKAYLADNAKKKALEMFDISSHVKGLEIIYGELVCN